ncbi:MAG: hypothetical protein PW789_05620 [Edaphobacter sp.]|uniref:aroma-sacti cluster domain-containing protein n=1 Tax=Edaphobacter sp. TaxID=1934404 RepID=UPI0023A4D3A6|nr:aroma-sacti cluster domain-containing protein [Edaphobacter sp.]MDE1176069.1 hypothetical protein [Edaphobacter sp.]
MSAKKVPAKKSPAKKVAAKKAVVKKAVKKPAPKKTNIEKLTAAGVIPQEHAGKHNHKVINKLSPTEVNTLIKLRSKLGALKPEDDALSPNFPV